MEMIDYFLQHIIPSSMINQKQSKQVCMNEARMHVWLPFKCSCAASEAHAAADY